MKHSTGITRFDHEQESGTVSLSDMSRNGTRRRRVWAASIATLAATLGLATLGVPGLQSSADAVAARPAVPPTAPPTNPTTPPTLPPPPPPDSDWRVRVEDLLQDENVGAISADRFWLTVPILTQDATVAAKAAPAGAAGRGAADRLGPGPGRFGAARLRRAAFPGDRTAPGCLGGAAGQGGGLARIVVPHDGEEAGSGVEPEPPAPARARCDSDRAPPS